MSMSVGNDGNSEETVIADINTTPLVDIMLVLLIIFLITTPVILQTAKVELPKEENIPTQTKPENIVISVTKDGDVFWDGKAIADSDALFEEMKKIAVIIPQPEVHVRGDENVRYESVGRVIYTAQRAAIIKIGFITEPPPRG
jgi:biopolymer transport protein ExbD